MGAGSVVRPVEIVQINPEQAKNLIEALDKYQTSLYPAKNNLSENPVEITVSRQQFRK